MSRYRYEELSPSQFENLVVDICRCLIGKGTRGFSEGPDGGRDARFDGVTDDYPSKREPWAGTTIIQAKHTSRMNASYSDIDFKGSGSVLDKEIPRIKKLIELKKLDHYLLFANRKLGANTDDEIVSRIASECGLALCDVHIAGVEEIDDLLARYPEISKRHYLDLLSAPLRITRDNLAEVIEAMHEAVNTADANPIDEPVKRTSLKRKNELNGVSEDEIAPIRKLYLKDTRVIEDFLSNPMNHELLRKYNEAIEELNVRLPNLIELHGGFMGAWHAVYDIMVDHEEVLRRNNRLVRAVQFYMYWNCDFGRSDDGD